MPYHKESFLAGIAVGRNMKSWPALEDFYEKTFAFVLRADRLETYMTYTFGDLIFEGTIDWGDGSTSEVTKNESHPSHTYTNNGNYIVRMMGDLWGIKFSSFSMKDTSGKMPMLVINPLPAYPLDKPLPYFVGVINIIGTFAYCPNLYLVPDNVFRRYKIPEIEVISGSLFRYDESLLRIPSELYKGLLFSSNSPSLTFDFDGCRSVTEIPDDLYDNDDLIGKAVSLDGAFRECGITEIPEDLLDKCRGAVTVGDMFLGTPIESIPSGLFSGLNDIVSFENTFLGCSLINSDVPALWVEHPNASGSRCFEGCTNATNWSSIPQSWGGPMPG